MDLYNGMKVRVMENSGAPNTPFVGVVRGIGTIEMPVIGRQVLVEFPDHIRQHIKETMNADWQVFPVFEHALSDLKPTESIYYSYTFKK